MADPRLKQIKIKTGIVRRIAKEKICYDNEANQQRARIQKMKDECKEEYAIRKQEEVLQESLMMVPDCQRRLEKAYEELKNILKDEKDLQDTDEYSLAKKALEEAQPLLPNPEENLSDMAYQANLCDSSFYSNSEFHNISSSPSSSSSYMPVNVIYNISCESEDWSKQRKNDEEFINNFIMGKAKKVAIKKVPLKIKIFEAKKYLTNIISLKKQIENDSNMINVNSDDFDVKYEELIAKKNEINDILSKFDEESVYSLKKALEKRRRKRALDRKKKEKQKVAIKEKNDLIMVKHELIDKLLGEKAKETESAKKKEALARQADSVLHNVQRKKYEAKKILNMLEALLKLRELRSKQEIALGGYCSEQVTETFTNVVDHFTNLWKKQLEVYNLEEKGLKVMLEESELPETKVNTLQKTLNQWEEAIFGIPNTDYNYKYLTQADDDINSFIIIRKQWDQYINNYSSILSSSIPNGWVLPPETDDNEWQAFVRSKKK